MKRNIKITKKAKNRRGYFGDSAFEYDERRFKTGCGKLFHSLELEQLKKNILNLEEGALICEIGCGTARFSKYLAEKGFNVVATDSSVDMLKNAKAKCAGIQNIKFSIAEGASLNFKDNHFDLVFAIRVLNQTESKGYAMKTIDEMIRTTKPGGLILIEFLNESMLFNRLRGRAGVRLSFGEIKEIAKKNGCKVINESGVLILPETILRRSPELVLPIYKFFEKLFIKLFKRYATRGYTLLKK